MTEACFPGPLCSVGAEVLGPAHVHVRVLLLYSQLLLLPHSNSSNTSRGRPGARHPPLRGDSATPGRLPAAGLIMTPKRDARGQHELSARAFCPRAACQPGCSAWHRQLARRRSQARLLGWLVPAVHEAATG